MITGIVLLLAIASGATGSPPVDAGLAEGMHQVSEGQLEAAVGTLDAVIGRLAVDSQFHAKDLSLAYLYKGVALVGMVQEEPAKECFRGALRHDPSLRLQRGELSDRVMRVFEAARKGKAESVMKRPSEVPKKAGLGAGAVALIVAGVLVTGGAAAVVAAGGGDSSATPAPTATPTPDPRTQITPISSAGPIQMSVVSAEPSPGSTISGCGATVTGCPRAITVRLRFLSDTAETGVRVNMDLKDAANYSVGRWYIGIDPGQGPFDLVAKQSLEAQYTLVWTGSRPTPAEAATLEVEAGAVGRPASNWKWSFQYSLAR